MMQMQCAEWNIPLFTKKSYSCPKNWNFGCLVEIGLGWASLRNERCCSRGKVRRQHTKAAAIAKNCVSALPPTYPRSKLSQSLTFSHFYCNWAWMPRFASIIKSMFLFTSTIAKNCVSALSPSYPRSKLYRNPWRSHISTAIEHECQDLLLS